MDPQDLLGQARVIPPSRVIEAATRGTNSTLGLHKVSQSAQSSVSIALSIMHDIFCAVGDVAV